MAQPTTGWTAVTAPQPLLPPLQPPQPPAAAAAPAELAADSPTTRPPAVEASCKGAKEVVASQGLLQRPQRLGQPTDTETVGLDRYIPNLILGVPPGGGGPLQ